MVKISIICLIYKSIKLMDAVWESAHKYTPMLRNGEAEFLFVANDPTDAVIKHLIDKKYNFIINRNKHYSEDELFEKGYGIPEYINRVYKGYNQGILHAKGQRIVLINSDNFFSPDWLENLMKYSDYKSVITSQLVERRHEKFSVFPGAIEHYFGDCIENFQEDEFVKFSYKVRKTGLKNGGAYMPAIMYRDVAIYAGLYPEGNIAGKTKEEIVRFGDEYFYDKLAKMGVSHYTALDSIVYHLKEGEREASSDNENIKLDEEEVKKYEVPEYKPLPVSDEDKTSNIFLEPKLIHNEVINQLINNNLVETTPKYKRKQIKILGVKIKWKKKIKN